MFMNDRLLPPLTPLQLPSGARKLRVDIEGAYHVNNHGLRARRYDDDSVVSDTDRTATVYSNSFTILIANFWFRRRNITL